MSRPIGEYSVIGTDSRAAVTNRLRMSATIAAIDMPACPPWPIAPCGDISWAAWGAELSAGESEVACRAG